jgi:hypothetical protein
MCMRDYTTAKHEMKSLMETEKMDGLYVMLGVRIRLYCGALEC